MLCLLSVKLLKGRGKVGCGVLGGKVEVLGMVEWPQTKVVDIALHC